MSIIHVSNPYGPKLNKHAYTKTHDPKIKGVLKSLKTPYLRLYPSRLDAIRNTNPFPLNRKIKEDLKIKLGDTRKKLWYGIDTKKRLQDSQKRLQLSRLNIPDDLTEKIGKEFTKKAGKKLTRKKSKNKIGGLQKKKTIMSNDSWENPHIDKKMDCCPCVFYYLGLINDDDYVQLYDKYSETGMYPVDIENFFKSKYPHFDFNILAAKLYDKSNKEMKKIIVNLFKSIKKGNSIIGGIHRKDGTRHCIVFSRTLDNQMALHDSQMNTAYVNNQNAIEYFKKNKVYSLFYLHSNYHKNITEKNDTLMLNSNNTPLNFYTAEDTSNLSDDYHTATMDSKKT
tara:strand:+ start:1501 stop:2517 length:1017 start_codon:yes stop_codon:yes gene_type:complete